MGQLRREVSFGLLLSTLLQLLHVAVALECVSPTRSGLSLSVSSCSVSTADLVVDVSQLGVGTPGGTRTVSVTNIDLGGRALIIAGWLASNPVDIARIDGYAMAITISGVFGMGRLIVSGNFPNMTTVTLTASVIALNTSVSTNVADAAYGCSNANTISSAMCVAAPSFTYTMTIGTYVTLSNTWDPVAAGSAYSGSVAVASSLALHVDDVGYSGSFTLAGSFLGTIVAAGDVALGAAGVFLQVQSNKVSAATFKFITSTISVDTSSSATVFAQGIAWSSSSSTAGVSLSGGSSMTFDKLVVSVISTGTNTAGGTIASSRAVGIGTTNSTGLLFQRGATMMLSNLNITIIGHDGANAYGLLFAHDVTIVRESILSVSDSWWVVATYGIGNASMFVFRIVGVFPSLVVVHNNTVNVSAYALSPTVASAYPGAIPSFAQFTASLNVDSQIIFHGNQVVLYSVDPNLPTGIIALRLNMDNVGTGAALTSTTAPAEETVFLRGGTLALTNSRIDFNGSEVNCTAIDGTSLDLVELYAGGVLRYTGVNLTSANVPSTVFLSMLDLSVNKVFGQRNQLHGYTFVTGCFGVQDVFPIYSPAPLYMTFDTLDQMTSSIQCTCATVLMAYGTTASVGGTYPNCHANCTQQSIAPFSWATDLCASPFVVTASVTITTKTVPPQHTVTTLTAFLSPSRASVTTSPTAARTQSLTTERQPTPTKRPTFTQTQTENETSWTSTGNATDSVARWSPTPAKDTKTHTLNLSLSRSPYPSLSVEPVKTLTWHITATEQTATSSRTKLPTATPQPSPSPTNTKGSASPTTQQSKTVTRSVVASASGLPTASKARLSLTATPSPPIGSPSVSNTIVDATATLPHSQRTARLSPTESIWNLTASPSKSPKATPTKKPLSITATYVVPPAPFMFVTESQILGFITLGVTTISSIVTGYPTVLHAQFIAVVGQSRAAGENSHQRTDPMAQIVSPFWSLGSTAVAAGNIVIIIVVIVVHAVVTKLGVLGGGGGNDAATGERKGSVAPGLGLQQQPSGGKGVELPDTWVIHRFPELSYVIALTFYQGLVNAAFSIFYHSDGPVFVIGTVCLLLTVALPLLLYYLLYRFLAGAWPPYRAVTFSHAFGWAFPHGYWSAGRVKRCFGRIFASTTDRGVRFTGYPLLLVLLVNAASNVQAVDKQQRDAQFGVLGLLFVVSAIFVAVSRPHRSNVTNVVYVISFTMLMILCVCLANEATNAGAADGVPVVIVVLEVLLWANGVYEIAVWFAEMRGVLHAARKAHMQGDESGTMRTRTVGARADAKKAAAARSAFVADEDNFLQTPNIASKTAASHQQESDESDDERRVRPLLLSSPSDDMTSSPVSVSSPFYVEMSSSPPPPPLNARHEDQHSSPFYATTFEVPTVQVPAPGKVAVAPPVVELTPQRQPPPSQQQAAASPPPPSPPPQDVQDDFLDMFAAAPPPAPAANKPPPSFGLLQRAQDESLVSKASKTAVGAKKPPAPPPGTKSGKPSSSKKKQKQSTSRRRGGSSSSSSDDIFGSDSDDSDL